MSRYRHYKNHGEGGQGLFATTTVLDFVRVFDDPEMAGLMVGSILTDCRFYGARLYCFVVMPHHVHLLLDLPPNMTAGRFMGKLKSLAARRIIPRLGSVRQRFSMQEGLNDRVFWQRSYRGLPVVSEAIFTQKANYIDWNPVRAGHCESPVDYRWGSARLWEEGLIGQEGGLAITDGLIARFCNPECLVVTRVSTDTLNPGEG